MGKNKRRTLSQATKETVDFIYDYLSPHPEGITMNAKQLGKTESRICSLLVRRGIITKNRSGFGAKEYRYKWVAPMPPTKVLYGSIVDEIRDQDRGYKDRHKNKQKQDTVMNQIEKEREEQEAVVVVDKPSLTQYTIQELWDEIKRRGGHIEGGQIAVTVTTYLN